MSFIRSLEDKTPQLHPSVFIAAGAVVVGDVVCGEDSSLWYNVVLRGDVGAIRIGARVNVQDLTMVHMSHGLSEAVIEDDVTVGHRAIIHGATIEQRSLIGMGAIILDNAVVGAESIVGANALVTKNMKIPPRSLVLGSPARVVRPLNSEEIAGLAPSAAHYVRIAERHRALGADPGR